MKKYKPTKAEALKYRKEEVDFAKSLMKSLTLGMDKYAKGSNVEQQYLSEKSEKLQREIKRMILK